MVVLGGHIRADGSTGLAAVIVSSALSPAMSVVTERALGGSVKGKRKTDDDADGDRIDATYLAVLVSAASSVIVAVVALGSGEWLQWGDYIYSSCASLPGCPRRQCSLAFTVLGLLSCVCFGQQLVATGRNAITQHGGAAFASMLKPLRRLVLLPVLLLIVQKTQAPTAYEFGGYSLTVLAAVLSGHRTGVRIALLAAAAYALLVTVRPHGGRSMRDLLDASMPHLLAPPASPFLNLCEKPNGGGLQRARALLSAISPNAASSVILEIAEDGAAVDASVAADIGQFARYRAAIGSRIPDFGGLNVPPRRLWAEYDAVGGGIGVFATIPHPFMGLGVKDGKVLPFMEDGANDAGTAVRADDALNILARIDSALLPAGRAAVARFSPAFYVWQWGAFRGRRESNRALRVCLTPFNMGAGDIDAFAASARAHPGLATELKRIFGKVVPRWISRRNGDVWGPRFSRHLSSAVLRLSFDVDVDAEMFSVGRRVGVEMLSSFCADRELFADLGLGDRSSIDRPGALYPSNAPNIRCSHIKIIFRDDAVVNAKQYLRIAPAPAWIGTVPQTIQRAAPRARRSWQTPRAYLDRMFNFESSDADADAVSEAYVHAWLCIDEAESSTVYAECRGYLSLATQLAASAQPEAGEYLQMLLFSTENFDARKN